MVRNARPQARPIAVALRLLLQGPSGPMRIEAVFILLFTLAAGVALVARWLRVPYTVALVIAGLLAGSSGVFHVPHLSQELLFTVFLPGLLFEAAFHLEFRGFWANKLAIAALAVPGVVISIGLMALLLTPIANELHFVENFTFGHGLVFAAVIAATDPIAVVSLFKNVGAPRRLGVLVEGESLLNDGTSVVLFSLVLSVVLGRQLSASEAALAFVRVAGLGAVVGAVVGYAVSRIIHKVDEAMVEITLTTIAAWGSFVLAEQLHCSGVIASVVAGMICGYAADTGMTATTRVAVESFWEYLAFALNSVVFLLIGFEVHVDALLASAKPILVALAVVVAGRACVVSLVGLVLRATAERIPMSWTAVLTWGGLRGSLSMVLVLGLPADFAHRELLITMTFGVVVLSILLQGLSMAPLLRWLGLTSADRDALDVEAAEAQILAADAALSALDDMRAQLNLSEELSRQLRGRFEERRAEAAEKRRRILAASPSSGQEREHAVVRQLLFAQKEALLRAHRRGALGEHSFEVASRGIDDELAALDHPRARGEEPVSPEGGPAPPNTRRE
jgi:CPA1 family monovalent cation:H+ antiporter